MMKRFSFLFLIGMLLALPVFSQGGNQWELMLSKTFVEGTSTDGTHTGIETAKEGQAAFTIQHYQPDFQGKKGFNNLHHLSVSWSNPQRLINFGDEDKISIDYKAMFDNESYSHDRLASDAVANGSGDGYEISIDVSPVSELRTEKATIGYTLMSRIISESTKYEEVGAKLSNALDGMKDKEYVRQWGEAIENNMWSSSERNNPSGQLECHDKWTTPTVLGDGAFMMVTVTVTFSTITYTTLTKPYKWKIRQFYLYKNNASEGYWEQTERYIVRNYQLSPVDMSWRFSYMGGPRLPRYCVDRSLVPEVDFGIFKIKDNYEFWEGLERGVDDSKELGSIFADFSISYTEPNQWYDAGESVKLTYSTASSIPSGIGSIFYKYIHKPIPLKLLTIEGGICYTRNSSIPLTACKNVIFLQNVVGIHSIFAKQSKDGTWVDVNENVSGEMPKNSDLGDVVWIRLNAHYENVHANIYYQYEWKEGKLPSITKIDNNFKNNKKKKDPKNKIPGEWIWIPTVVFLGGGAFIVWKRVKPHKDYRPSQKKIITKRGTADETAIKKMGILDRTTDYLEGYKNGIESDIIDQNIIILDTADKTGKISQSLILAYYTSGLSVGVQAGIKGVKTFYETMEKSSNPDATYNIFKSVWKGGWDAVKTGITGGKGEIANYFVTKFIYGNMVDIVGNIPEMAEKGGSPGKVFSMLVKNGINSAINMDDKGLEAMTQETVEVVSDNFFDLIYKKK